MAWVYNICIDINDFVLLYFGTTVDCLRVTSVSSLVYFWFFTTDSAQGAIWNSWHQTQVGHVQDKYSTCCTFTLTPIYKCSLIL